MIGAHASPTTAIRSRSSALTPEHLRAGRSTSERSDERRDLFSLRNPWFAASVGVAAALCVGAALVGFVWLPSAQPDAPFQGIWDAICSAAGVAAATVEREAPVRAELRLSSRRDDVATCCATPSAEVDRTRRDARASMRDLSRRRRGVSRADSPNLAGQYAGVIYKELHRFPDRRARQRGDVAVRGRI